MTDLNERDADRYLCLGGSCSVVDDAEALVLLALADRGVGTVLCGLC